MQTGVEAEAEVGGAYLPLQGVEPLVPQVAVGGLEQRRCRCVSVSFINTPKSGLNRTWTRPRLGLAGSRATAVLAKLDRHRSSLGRPRGALPPAWRFVNSINVPGLGFEVRGSGFRSLEFRVQGSGFSVRHQGDVRDGPCWMRL